MDWIGQLPAWSRPWISTGIVVGVAYLAGLLIIGVVRPRLLRLAARTRRDWDDIVLDEVSKRVPFWALLVGLWVALGYWDFGDNDARYRALATSGLVLAAGVSVTLAIARILTRLMLSYQREVAPDVPVTAITQNLIRILVFIVGGLMIANTLGLEITAALTALGIGGLAVALALQEPLSNLFAGLFLSLAGQLRVGDYVELESGQAGFIVDLDWRATRIRALANNVIIVPNSKLAQTIVTNYGLPEPEMAVLVAVSVDYGSDLRRVQDVTLDVARGVLREVEGGIPDFEPLIRFHTFADSSIEFNVILRGKSFVDQFLLRHEFIKRLHARYGQEGITIPFPIRTLAPRAGEPLPVVVVAGDGAGGESSEGGR